MANSKDEILSNLYSIRAGLSVISECSDEVQKYENDTASAKSALDAYVKDGEGRTFLLKQENENRATNSKRYEKEIAQYSKSLKTNTNEKDKKVKFAKFNIVLGLVLFGLSVLLSIVMESGAFLIPGVVLAIFFSGMGLIFNSNFYLGDEKTKVTYDERNLQNAKKLYAENSDPEVTTANEEEIAFIAEETVRRQGEYNALALANQGEIDQWATKANLMFNALKNQFNSFLDYRDWDYLDLVIFHFETNRVDTLRESLLLVDTQRQNDRLVEAINQASTAICTNIRETAADLQATMISCFNALQYSINSQLDSLGSQMKSIGTGISSLKAEIRQSAATMAENQNMQNALLKKSNVTSQALASDMRKMRSTVQDIENRQRRNSTY